jgi:hypothetical protein
MSCPQSVHYFLTGIGVTIPSSISFMRRSASSAHNASILFWSSSAKLLSRWLASMSLAPGGSDSAALRISSYVLIAFSIRKLDCGEDRFLRHSRMRIKKLLDAFSGRQLFENQLDSYSRSGDDWFAHHDRGIGVDKIIHIVLNRNKLFSFFNASSVTDEGNLQINFASRAFQSKFLT